MPDTLFTEQTLAEQRPVLFRYALLQLRDSELADDAVQETLLAALQSASGFEGKAGVRTWLIGILNTKSPITGGVAPRSLCPGVYPN